MIHLKYLLYIIIACVLIFILYILISKFFNLIVKLDEKYEKSKTPKNNTNTDYSKIIYDKYKYCNTEHGKKENSDTIHKEKQEETFPECLTILGFTKYPNDIDEIKTRYKKLTKIYHPDSGGTEEEFQRINKAYEESLALSKYNKH